MAATADKRVLWPALAVTIGASLLLIGNPGPAEELLRSAFAAVTRNFGWLLALFGLGALLFLLGLALGPYGRVRLGAPDARPEFSTLSWVAMMFTAGVGIGLMNWSFVEPIYYLNDPPFGAAPRSAIAVEWASVYGPFHWGPIGWAIYTLPAVAIAYAVYVKNAPSLRLSVAAGGLLGNHRSGWLAAAVDVFVVVGIVGGTGTSLGLGIPLVAGLLGELLGVPDSVPLRLGIVALWTVIFGTSVALGLKRGIRLLADVNVVLALALLGFVLVVGPTGYILALSTSSLGLMLDSFFRMSLWLDPVQKGGFPEEWTLFYWSWWVAYAPMLGLFVARISRGRTIRQLVLGEIVWGSLGCAVFYWVWGSYALHLETSGGLDISATLDAAGIPGAVLAVLASLPGSFTLTVLFTVLCFIFLATTLDSAAYVIASICTRDLPGDAEPARWNRLCWAGVLALVAIGLLGVGGVKAAQTSTVIVALPLLPILIVSTLSLLRWLRADAAFTSDLPSGSSGSDPTQSESARESHGL